jgi:polar amino acid transport system substrate-binding protein
MENKQVLVVKAEDLAKYSDPANLADASIVAEEGSAGETVAKENSYFQTCTFTATGTQANALMEVKSGTANGALVDYVASIGMIGEGTDNENLVVVDAYDFNPEEYGIAFRKDDTEIIDKFQKAIDELMADGTIDAIAEKYKLQDLLVK